ncbi:SurA N-terminal domain-containing protein [Anaerocellum danielii]|uniref:SurA N-terminal domain-containing protein n=1 Tax=Anaerocellum danielii TaxID=1387557 RepID=A0ABZ0TWV7_9FIRM|nr:SurA N-terminal domain-containing protein [Caldicellulosiruptor danielii]WPX07729.1 SurA N-terminal domain-containing protein [Caldicellulosiruptor danielii]
MKKKRVRRSFSLIIVAVISLMSFSIVFSADIWTECGKKIKKIQQSKDNRVVAVVNGEKIYKKDLEIAYALEEASYLSQKESYQKLLKKYKTNSLKPPVQRSKREVLESMIENLLLLQAAKKGGYFVSEKEAKDYYEKTMKTMQDIMSGVVLGDVEGVQFANDAIEKLIKGWGITREEYDKKAIEQTRNMLSIQKLLNAKFKEFKLKSKNLVIENFRKEYINSLKKKAKITIYEKNI